MNLCIIYRITNLENSKSYVGQTWQTLHNRWISHRSNRKERDCIKLKRAIQKYGKDNFKIELLTVTGTQIAADYWECFFISKYDSIKNGYNIREGGSSGKLSVSTRYKMSVVRRGKKHTEATKLKMRIARLGKNFPNISKSLIGKTHSEETKNKIRLSKLGKKRGSYKKRNM